VLGVIKTMSSIDQPPEILGKMIGGALVGTFLGVFLAYGVVGPFATRLRSVIDEEQTFYGPDPRGDGGEPARSFSRDLRRGRPPAHPQPHPPELQRARRGPARRPRPGRRPGPRRRHGGMISQLRRHGGMIGRLHRTGRAHPARWPAPPRHIPPAPRPSAAARLAALLAGCLAAAPALAQEGGTIRSGEHADFSRIVMIVEPTTEWSLELGPRAATISFPGKAIPFSAAGIFQRMPATRIAAVEPVTGPGGTEVRIALACDCRVSTAFVGARYLAVDVHENRRSQPAAAGVADPATGASGPTGTAAGRRPAPSVEAALASAERILIDQLERAASQGLVGLADDPAAAAAGRGAGDAAPGATPPDTAAPSPDPLPEPAAAAPAIPDLALEHEELDLEDSRLLAHLASTLSTAHEQITATTVYDRDARAAAPAETVPSVCRADEALDVARWSDGRPLHDQAVALRGLLVGEFDRPNPAAVRDLVRLHIRHGLGTEAGEILRGFPVDIEDRELLADLARVVESRPPAPGGPLALGVACPGRHGLWLAAAGSPVQIAAEDRFRSIRTAFEDMPPDLRALIGPDLVNHYLDAGRPPEARFLHDIVIRPGAEPDIAMTLSAGRLAAAEYRPLEAEVRLAGLVAANATNAADALLALVRTRLDFGDRVPSAWMTDLGALALEHRRGPREIAARALRAEALARNGALGTALVELDALARDRPEARPIAEGLAPRLLAAADPAAVGAAAYAEAVLAHQELVTRAPANDYARMTIARGLLELGLPNTALVVLAPPVDREIVPARLLAARAHTALAEPAPALALLAGLDGAEAEALRARAHAGAGDFAAATDVLARSGREAEALSYAWAAGAWSLAAAAPDPARAAMASWMRDRAAGAPPAAATVSAAAAPGPRPRAAAPSASAPTSDLASAPAPDPAIAAASPPAPPTPEAAFGSPTPRRPGPSLAGARDLIASGAAVGDFVDTLLSTD
jgi:hypothetical protein